MHGDNDELKDRPQSTRRLFGVTMRAPGVSVSFEKETVGELTERYIDDEQRSERRSAFLEAIVSVVGLVVGLVSLTLGALPLGGDAVALFAALVGLVGVGLLTATWSIANSVQRRARANDEQPLSDSLLALREQLFAMRQPLLKKSVSIVASEEEA